MELVCKREKGQEERIRRKAHIRKKVADWEIRFLFSLIYLGSQQLQDHVVIKSWRRLLRNMLWIAEIKVLEDFTLSVAPPGGGGNTGNVPPPRN